MTKATTQARQAAVRMRHLISQRSAYRRDPVGAAMADKVRSERLTFLEHGALMDLWTRMKQIEEAGLEGSVMEAGCALGGSAIMLAAAKNAKRPMEVFDVFGMIPEPSDRDGEDVHERYRVIAEGRADGFAGDTYYGYIADLKGRVAASFEEMGFPIERNNVRLVQGLFEDTINPTGPIALAHIDGDWYDSVKVCLERMWPQLVVGGVLVIDDYSAWSGCRSAVNDWLVGRSDVRFEQRSRPHLVKLP